MIISAHQPNYMPWIGYFFKMMHSDKFVLADDVQYTSHSYINRVRIKTAQGKQWLTVPVVTRGRGLQKIKDIKIANSQNWQHKHWRGLQLNYKYAPYFEYYADSIKSLYQKEWTFLVDLNIEIIKLIRQELDITCPLYKSSDYSFPESPTQWIVEMVKASGGTLYISGQSGKDYLEEEQFKKAGIELKYSQIKAPEYRQQFGPFMPGLSIVDLLFNEGPAAKIYLKNSGNLLNPEQNPIP